MFWDTIRHTIYLLRRHVRRADRDRLHVRGAAALQGQAAEPVQGHHLHPGRAGAGHDGADLPADLLGERAVQHGPAATSGSARWPTPGSPSPARRCRSSWPSPIWEWTGVTFILYFAAMTQIDPEMLEAARIDGANGFQVLTRIVWPNVRGTTIALAMLSVIGALKTFDVPYLVTLGGPNYATEFLGTFIYRISIPQAEVGYGAALSIMLLILALAGASGLRHPRNEEELTAMFETRRLTLEDHPAGHPHHHGPAVPVPAHRDGAGVAVRPGLGQLPGGVGDRRGPGVLPQQRDHRGRRDRHRLLPDHAGRVRLLQAAHPRAGRSTSG